MNIPNIPTDNLYKFIALTGVIIFILTLFYPELKRQELNDEITLINGQIEILDYEKHPLEQQTKEIKKKITELDKLCDCGFKSIINDSLIVKPKIISGPKEIMELTKQIDILIQERDKLIEQTNFKALEINTKTELIRNKQDNLDELNKASAFFIPFSFILSTLGFLFWFTQTQRYQDSLLKEQYEQLKKFERCQSCGIHFSNDCNYNQLTSEEKQKLTYCSVCYNEDKFTEPEITFKEMKEKVRNRCKELGFNKLKIFIYLLGLNDLERWRPKFKWK